MKSVALALAILVVSANAIAQSSLVHTIDASQFVPASPDTAGLAYQPFTDRLLMCDSEVNELVIYSGVNVWELTPDGFVLMTSDTTSFSNEPTGVAYNPSNDHWFFSDDNAKRIFEVDPGPDGSLNTADDVLTSFSTTPFGSFDPEGLAFDTLQGHLFIVDGMGSRIFEISPGLNGVFDGIAPGGDDGLAHFDTVALNLIDPEGVEHNADDDTLFILDQNTKTVAQTTRNGLLIQTIDLGFLNMRKPSGMTYAPGSSNPSVKHLYIADRGVDNGDDPDENDGMIFEITLPSDDPGRYDARVGAGTDDAEERPSGSVSVTSPDLDLVFDAPISSDQTIGIRFTEVGIPPAALITNAYIQFAADEIDSTFTSLSIKAHADDDSPTFSTASGNITSRAVTGASTAWSPPAWDLVGDQGLDQRTPDLSSVLQEVVNRPGWQICNSLSLIITGSGERVAEAYDGNFGRRPLLHIDYDPAACADLDGDGKTICHCECDDTDNQVWSIPGAVRNLRFDVDDQTLRWDVPQEAGGPAPLYDTIRSSDANDFVSTAVCVESNDGSDKLATDTAQPLTGDTFYYLIRAKNNCGVGGVGSDSNGAGRSALSCP